MSECPISRDEMDTRPIYGHRANDGKAFVSFDTENYWAIERLEGATTYVDGNERSISMSITEWVEARWFGVWDAYSEEWIDTLPTEGEREGEKLRVGTFYYSEAHEIVDAEIDSPRAALTAQ